MKKSLALLLALLMLVAALSGCEAPVSGPEQEATVATEDFAKTEDEMFTQRDLSLTYENPTDILLEGDGASCASSGVRVDGSTVIISAAGTYRLSGTLNDGMIVVDADGEKVQLVLDGVDIYSAEGAAICVLDADKVFMTLAPGSENRLANGEAPGTVGNVTIDGAIHSQGDLTVNGTGSLEISSPAGHGISCKDDLAVTGGKLTVACAGHGLDANDSVRICGGSITVDAGKDGIHAENKDDASLGFVYLSGGELDLETEGDGISAGAFLQIEDGTVTILAGGGYENGTKSHSDGWGNMGGRPGGMGRSGETTESAQSMKGLKAATGILINGGAFTVDSADDGIHSDDSVTINGGSFTIASGDDAVHGENKLTVTHCAMTVTNSYEGLEAHEIYISGGELTLKSSDDGLNAAGGVDSSGNGGRDDKFGGGQGGPMGGPMGGGDSTGMVEISGGTLRIQASGDGIDANGSLHISGGFVQVQGPTRGDTATLDYDTAAEITGGTFIGTGGAGMAQSFSKSTQGVFACSVGNQKAGTGVVLADGDGNALFEFTPELDFAVVILSCPELVSGQEYTITVGDVSGTLEAE